MATAREIACLYGNPDQIDDLERAILRHMERYMNEAAKVERERCSKKAREFASHYEQGSDGRNTFIILAEWVENKSGARSI